MPNTSTSLLDIYTETACVCFQEAKAIIAQRSDNPREFFKNKERAMATSVDTSPVSIHRTGKQMAALCVPFILRKKEKDYIRVVQRGLVFISGI